MARPQVVDGGMQRSKNNYTYYYSVIAIMFLAYSECILIQLIFSCFFELLLRMISQSQSVYLHRQHTIEE
jgi:hypothetical protein